MFRRIPWTCAAILILANISAAQDKPAEKPALVIEPGGHSSGVVGLAFTPDGKELISLGNDYSIRFWDVAKGDLARVLYLPTFGRTYGTMALSPNGRLLAFGLTNSRKEDGIALMPLPANGTFRHLIVGENEVVGRLAFSPDGKKLASGAANGKVRLWNVQSGLCERVMAGHSNAIGGLAFSPDGKRLATCSADLTLRIWDVGSGKEEKLLQDPAHRTGHWNGLAWSPDGKTIVTGCLGVALRIWNAEDGTLREFLRFIGASRSIVFTKDSKAILFANRVFDLERKELRAEYPNITGEFWAVALAPDGRTAATAGGAGEDLILWDTQEEKLIHHFAGKGRMPRGTGWSPDGKFIGWGTTLAGYHDWFRPQTHRLRHPLERSFDPVELIFGPHPRPDWRRFRPLDGGLTSETAVNGGFSSGWVNVKEGEATLCTIKQNWSSVFTFLPGERLVLGGGHAGLKMYQARTGKLLQSFQGKDSQSVAPSPDCRFLLAAQSDQALRIWAINQEEPLLSIFFADHEWVAWTPQGYYAASSGGEKLMGWQTNNGDERVATFHPAARFRNSLYRPDVIKLVLKTGSVAKALELADKERGKTSSLLDVSKVLPPACAITSPDNIKTETTQPKVEVRALAFSVGEHPITSLRLIVNGRPYGGEKNYDPPRKGQIRESWHVELVPGRNSIAVQAESPVSKALSEPVEIVLTEARGIVRTDGQPKNDAKNLPNLYVLAIGISEYPGELTLRYAAKDAKVLAKTFEATSRDLYRNVEVKLITDKEATRKNLLQGFTWLKKSMTQHDVAIITFAGHGEKDSDGRLYLLPVDVDREDLVSSAVPSDQVKNLLSTTPGRVIVMLDACHSGAVDGEKRRAVGGLTDDLVRDLVSDDYGVVVMCSSTGKEFSLEGSDVQHGYFTLAVVEGLAGMADLDDSGAVYLNELDSYVTRRVKDLSRGRQHPVTTRPATIRSFPLSRPRKQS